MHPGFIDMTGVRIGSLVVLKRAPNRAGVAQWSCCCRCGAIVVLPGIALRELQRRGRDDYRCPSCRGKRPGRVKLAPEERTAREQRRIERRRRKREVRACTVDLQRSTKKRRLKMAEDDIPANHSRPRTRSDCEWCRECQLWRDAKDRPERPACGHTPTEALQRSRPCAFVGCKYHLFLDVSPGTGNIKLNFPDLEPGELKESCALDIALSRGETLEDVGEAMNVTRERVRQIEVMARARLEKAPNADELRDYLREYSGLGEPYDNGSMPVEMSPLEAVEALEPLLYRQTPPGDRKS